jgi:hypothetical protein
VIEILSGNADFATCVGQTFRRHTVAEVSPTVFYKTVVLITGHPKKEFVEDFSMYCYKQNSNIKGNM